MVKDLRRADLLDMYGQLLTPKQRNMMQMYFYGDLSLGEISQNEGVSRQAVADCISKCSKKLEEYEHKLGMCEKYEATQRLLSAIDKRDESVLEYTAAVHAVWEDNDGI